MLKIGVLGAGHLGKIHIKQIKEIEGFELIGFYDPDNENAHQASGEFSVKRFEEVDALIDNVDVIDIVTPTLSHHKYAVQALRKTRHVFIEKPMTNTLEEAKDLLELSEEANAKIQIGHVERFNPALLALKEYTIKPMFIESHRLAPFNPRGTDVSVILDLMIHDIDIALKLVKSNVRNLSASGVDVISDSADIANARLEFDNGCVANFTSSRFALKKMRKMRIFQKDAYFSIDFAERKTEVFRLSELEDTNTSSVSSFEIEHNNRKRTVHLETPPIQDINSIKMELELFRDAILHDTETEVTVMDGYKALDIAHQILKKIEKKVLT